MKKFSLLLISFLLLSFVSCGPSAKQKAAEQARLDSIAAVEELRIQDSIAEAEALKAAKAAAAADAISPEVTAPVQPEGTTRTRSVEAKEADQSDVTRIRRAPEESVKEVVDSTTTRKRRSGVQ
ncbi:MAG: hypothetical protein V2I46_05235 [Bacteroides sp.]|jgi:hypothetical protein|nr:hypothetical protein [Bacteroides sp.]